MFAQVTAYWIYLHGPHWGFSANCSVLQQSLWGPCHEDLRCPNLKYHNSSNCQHLVKCIFRGVWAQMLCEISKHTFEVSHKILNPYIAKYAFYWILFLFVIKISWICNVISQPRFKKQYRLPGTYELHTHMSPENGIFFLNRSGWYLSFHQI